MTSWRGAAALVVALTALAGCADDGKPTSVVGPGGVEGGVMRTSAVEIYAEEGVDESSAAEVLPQLWTPDVNVTVKVTGGYPMARYEIDISEAPAGTVIRVDFFNEDTNDLFPHGWFIEGVPESTVGTWSSGESGNSTFFAPKEPGEFIYYCTVAKNRDLGMEGVFRFT